MSTLLKPALEWGARCDSCPLLAQPMVPCEPALQAHPRVYVVGEGPGKVEVVHGRPFTGETGATFNGTLDWAHVSRSSVHVTNSTLCLPVKHMTSKQWTEALNACQPRLVRELADVPAKSLVILMGGRAIKQVIGKDKVKEWRGYPLPANEEFAYLNERGVICFPMYHPAHLFRKPWFAPIFKLDFGRALDMLNGVTLPWKWPPLYINEGPDMDSALDRLAAADWIGVDVEAAGEDPFTAPLLTIGIASEKEAVSLQWRNPDRHRADRMKEILAAKTPRKVFQNGNFDLISLKSWRVPCSANDFDTLIAHRILAPLLPHDLQFIALTEFAVEQWKAQFKVGDDRKGSFKWAEQADTPSRFEALRTYNAKDALMTALLRAPMQKRLEESA